MSEKEVIKRTERLKREGIVRQLSAQFDARALGYRSSLVAAKVEPERIDEAAPKDVAAGSRYPEAMMKLLGK